MENSLADIAAVVNRDGEWNGGCWWIILLFLVMYGGNWNRNGCEQYATAATQQEILFGQQFQNLDNKIDRMGYGIADSTFALNNAIGEVGTRALEAKYDLGSKIDNCCCTTQRSIDSVKYEGAMNTAAINANIDAKFAALEKSNLEQRIAEQASQIQQLRLEQQMCGVVRYPNGYAYNAGPSPFCGCGCGSNI